MGGHVIYEDSGKRQTDLGEGFSPILMANGKVALVRGNRFGYSEPFDCGHKETKNWIVLYNPAAKQEKAILDRPLTFGRDKDIVFCNYQQMQVSHDGAVLYLVIPMYATCISLAIIHLPRGESTKVDCVNAVYVIEAGPHRDELIYVSRVSRTDPTDGVGYPAYPVIHARADGREIEEISDEPIVGDKLEAYLHRIGGTITVDGRRLPSR